MTKRIGSLLLALIMTISLAVPAMAVTETEQTEEPTASTVEPTAPTDADTPADTSAPAPEETPDASTSTPEKTPAPSETEKDTDSKEKKTAAKKAVVSIQSVQSDLDAYFADLPLTAKEQDGASNLQWSVKNGIVTSPSGFKSAPRSLTLTATADTHLTFQYKVSTEANYD